ncbi:queuosine precursor transporter [bacterium]|nr:queuosine precursor transporter [bacterium]
MGNNSLFILQAIVGLSFTLIAFKFGLPWLMMLIAVQAVIMNIFVLKMMNVFSFEITGGNVLYASIFLGTDIICEHYGKDKARQAVWMGFFASLFFIIMSQFIVWYNPSTLENSVFLHNTLTTIFNTTPRIVLASMISYLISQHLDIYIYTSIKKVTGDKLLWLRNNGSTFISQLFDSIFFSFAGLYGIVANAQNVWQIILFTYIVKIIIAVMDTPFIYLSKMWPFRPHLKKEIPQKNE